MEAPDLAIIFGRTKRRVDELSEALKKRGYSAEGLHGDLSQNQRDHVMKKFRDGSIDVLVATDVAARGLDVTGVSHVINFDLPQDPESYVHRIGRTGRAGKEGVAITFVTPRETDQLHLIERITRHRIAKRPQPSLAEAVEGKQRVAAERLHEELQSDDFNMYKGLAIQLLEQYDSVQVMAAALKLLTGEKQDVAIHLTPEEPLRVKKRRHDGRSGGRDNRGRDYRGRDSRNRDSRYGGRKNPGQFRRDGKSGEGRKDKWKREYV